MMRTIVPPKDNPKAIYQYVISGVGPRPIALVSTRSKSGIRNLSPFSFFNVFSINPLVVGFSTTRKSTGGFKDTYTNLMDTKECVIQSVTYQMVEQVNRASGEFSPDVDEFVESGLTPLPSIKVAPPRVKESPFQMECNLKEMITLGTGRGGGNLAICEVLLFHVASDESDPSYVHPDHFDLVGRNGGSYYTRAQGAAIFRLERPK